MLLAADIGNSHITMGVFDGDNMTCSFRLNSKMSRTSDEFGVDIVYLLKNWNIMADDIDDVIISSVVPDTMHSFENAMRKYFNVEPMIVGPGTKTGLKIGAENPKEIGADLIVNAVAGNYYYEAPMIIIDYGTATTFQYIDADKVYQAAVICPGIRLMAKALGTGAAKIPEVEIKKPKSIMGRNSIDAIQAGIVYGNIGQTEYIVNQMKKESGEDKVSVIATGGLGRILADTTESIEVYDRTLTMRGLNLIYKMNKKRNV